MNRHSKVFFSSTLEAALAQARRELGPEALLVEAGPAGPGGGAGGGYRVVCEVEEPAPRPEREPPAPEPGAGAPGAWEAVSRRLARLEQTLEVVVGAVAELDPRPGAAALQAELAARDFPAETARRLVVAAEQRLADGADPGQGRQPPLRSCLAEELAARISFTGGLSRERPPSVIALAGPPGAGKTTALVKLAMREGIARRRSVAIVTTDSHRVAAAEQLRTYCAILGLPFAQAETPASLRQTAAGFASKDLVLVDTPGFSRSEPDWALEWTRLLCAIPERQTHLVLPATWRARDLIASVAWWARFEPRALLFTRLDETDCFGGWAAAAIESGLPISYFSTGQRIPEDIEVASRARLEASLDAEAARAAAAGGRP